MDMYALWALFVARRAYISIEKERIQSSLIPIRGFMPELIMNIYLANNQQYYFKSNSGNYCKINSGNYCKINRLY